MSFTMKELGKRISRQTRRSIAAVFIAGSMVTSSFVSSSIASAFESHDSYFADSASETSPSSNPTNDYWIFSDDYFGWASNEVAVAPYSVNPYATEPVRRSFVKERLNAAEIIDRTLSKRSRRPRVNLFEKPSTLLDHAIAKALSNLTSPRPLSAPTPTAVTITDSVQQPIASLVGSSPIIVSIAEGYRPYDFINEDQITLRSFPISIPQFRYLGGRRTMDQSASDYGPLDCLGHGVTWSEEELPSRSVSIGPPITPVEKSSIWKVALQSLNQVSEFVSERTARETAIADAKRREALSAIYEAVQPDSRFRESLAPDRFGKHAATSVASLHKATRHQLQAMTKSIANNLHFAEPETRAEQLEKSAGERLLVRAGIEVDPLDCATAGVADVVQKRVCCPVERVDLAAQAPATHQFAAIGVAAATLEMPLRPLAFVAEPVDERIDGIAQAEALATACDHAAATLERVAMALRRAGDSFVRVAKGTATEAGTELR